MADRKYTITLEDGRSFEASADAAVTPEEILAEAERSSGVKVKTLDINEAGYGAKSLAKDVAHGALKTGAAYADILSTPGRELAAKAKRRYSGGLLKGLMAPPEMPGPEAGMDYWPQSRETAEAAQAVMPQAPAEGARQFVRAGLEGAGGGLAGGFGAPGAAAVAGASGGLGSELAVRQFGEGMPQRLGGGLAGGVAAVPAMAATRVAAGGIRDVAQGLPFNVRNLAEQTMRGSDPANVQIAADRMRDASAAGVPINASQAMLRPSNIDAMIEFLANSQHGTQTIDMLRKQPSQLRTMAEIMKSRLPGQVTSAQDTANRVQEAATSAVSRSQKRAGAAYRAEIPPGTTVAVPRIEAFSAALDRYAEAHPNIFASDLAKEVKRQLARSDAVPATTAPVGSGKVTSRLTVKGQPTPPDYLTDVHDLKAAVDEVLGGFGKNNPNMKVSPAQANRYAQEIRTLFDRTIATPGTPMRKARAAARQVFETETNPMKKSVVGRLMGPQGANDVREAPQAQLRTLLNRGTPEGGFSEIKQLEAALRREDPTAFVDLVKTYLTDTLNAQLPKEGQRLPSNLAEKWLKSLAGNPNQSRGLDDMLAGVARSKGVPEETVVKGFRSFVDLLGMAERIPNKISGMPTRDIEEVAGASRIAAGFESRFLGSGLGHKIRAIYSGKAYELMDKLLTTPEGLETLQQLAKVGSKSPKSLVILDGLIGGLAANQPSITEPK